MKCEKPQLTESELAQCKKLKELYLKRGVVTYDDAIATLDLTGNSETQKRKVRELQAIFGQYYPLINLSSEQGSRMADPTAESWEDAWGLYCNVQDFNSRIDKLNKRIAAMIRWLDKFKEKHGLVTDTDMIRALKYRFGGKE